MISEMISEISKIIIATGERCPLVSDGVIDNIIGLPVKNWDIEVYGISYKKLIEILSVFDKPNLVGNHLELSKLR